MITTYVTHEPNSPGPWRMGDEVEVMPTDDSDELWALQRVLDADGDTVAFVGAADPNETDHALVRNAPRLAAALKALADATPRTERTIPLITEARAALEEVER